MMMKSCEPESVQVLFSFKTWVGRSRLIDSFAFQMKSLEPLQHLLSIEGDLDRPSFNVVSPFTPLCPRTTGSIWRNTITTLLKSGMFI